MPPQLVLCAQPIARCSPPRCSAEGQPPPWTINTYYTKKLSRRTDSLGNIISSPETTAAPPAWTADAKLRLAADALAAPLGLGAEDLLERVKRLAALLPGDQAVLEKKPAADVVRLAAQVEAVPAGLIALREILPPGVDVVRLLTQWPEVLTLDERKLQAGVDALREAFVEEGEAMLCEMLGTTPQLLQAETLEACLRGGGHLMPRRQLACSLARWPDFYLQFELLTGQSRGERNAEYLEEMRRPVAGAQRNGAS